jgi:hypothetical protein
LRAQRIDAVHTPMIDARPSTTLKIWRKQASSTALRAPGLSAPTGHDSIVGHAGTA